MSKEFRLSKDTMLLDPSKWKHKYRMFKSPSKSVDPGKVYHEYGEALKDWIRKNPKGNPEDFRKQFGVLLSTEGKEVLSSAFLRQRKRKLRESQQGQRVIDVDGKPVKAPSLEGTAAKYRWEKQLQETVEDVFGKEALGYKGLHIKNIDWKGHHVKGLGNLNPFFQGASIEEAFELRQSIANRGGYVAGAQRGNWAWMSAEQHDLAHEKLGWATQDKSDYDFDRPRSSVEGRKTSSAKGVSNLSDKLQAKLAKTPFKRPKWQEDLLAKGVPRDKIQGFTLTRSDYLNEYLDVTNEAYQEAVDSAIREKPMRNWRGEMTVDPELQILANKRINNPEIQLAARESLVRSSRKLKLGKAAAGLGRGEALMRIAAGDYVGGTVGLAMQTDTFRNKVMKELLKRGGKSAAKLMPGVGVTMGALETAGYASQGRFTQSAIAAFGAAAGEIPGVGDLVQGGTDLLNTGIDIATGNFLPDANLDDDYLNNQRQLTRSIRQFN